MQLSTKGRYGSRAMLDLASKYGQGPVMVREIASRQQLSEKYLEQILSELRKAGLVVSFQGKKGGFQLARAPHEINMREVVECLEGSFAPVRCVDDATYCERIKSCAMKDVWDTLKTAQISVLEKLTLENLLEIERKKQNPGSNPDYSI